MANANVPTYAQKYRPVAARILVAAGALPSGAPTGVVELARGANNAGTLVRKIWAMPCANATLSSLILYIAKAETPTVLRFLDSEAMAAYTFAVTTKIPKTFFGDLTATEPYYLAPGDILFAAAQVVPASGIDFTAQVADL